MSAAIYPHAEPASVRGVQRLRTVLAVAAIAALAFATWQMWTSIADLSPDDPAVSSQADPTSGN